MNDVIIRLHHPELNILSDRTFRYLLRRLSAACRELQIREMNDLIDSSELTLSERQSLRDRMRGDLEHMDGYYLETVERGSLTLTVMVTGGALWILQNTLAISVQEAWKKARVHESIVDLLSSDRGDRYYLIERNADLVLSNWNFDRFLVDDLSTEQVDGDIRIEMQLETWGVIQEQLDERYAKIDSDFLVKTGQDFLAKIEIQ